MEVTLENWQVGPANRWAYHHVAEVVATTPVRRGDGPVAALEVSSGALEALYREHLDGTCVDGVVVLQGGVIAFERYEGEMGPDDLHLSQSVGKSVLGLLIGVLVERGELRLADLVAEHVPEVARSGYAGATVHHLLDMTAAIDFSEDYDNFWRYDLACGWFPPRPGEPETILAFLPGIGPAPWRHGERFHYATPNTDLLGLVAERAGGAPLAELIAQHLWQPLGPERDALLTVDAGGTAAIGGGFCATARDYARLGQLVLDGGRGIVPAPWLDGLGRGDPDAFTRRTWPAADDDDGASAYGRHWWTQDGRTAARGIHGQTVVVDRPSRTVVAVLSSWPDAVDPNFVNRQRAFADAVVGRLAS